MNELNFASFYDNNLKDFEFALDKFRKEIMAEES